MTGPRPRSEVIVLVAVRKNAEKAEIAEVTQRFVLQLELLNWLVYLHDACMDD